MHGNNILCRVCIVHQIHLQLRHFVFQADDGGDTTLPTRQRSTRKAQFRVVGAIGILYMQSRFANKPAARSRVGQALAAVIILFRGTHGKEL